MGTPNVYDCRRREEHSPKKKETHEEVDGRAFQASGGARPSIFGSNEEGPRLEAKRRRGDDSMLPGCMFATGSSTD